MRILMVSPHPTYSPRGTPISVLNRARALCALGHEVDLVTYGIGTDVPVAGLRWLRAPVPGIRRVKVGPSPAKVPLDLAVFARTAVRAIRGRRRYDVIHTHEEAGLLGALLSRLLGMPHVYDMGNDLSVVLRNYGLSARHPLTRLAVGVETVTVRGSHSVIAHFPAIATRVQGIGAGRVPATVVENVPVETPADAAESARRRARWSPDGRPVALYTGTLEAYQGLDALLEAMALLDQRSVPLRLVVLGGSAPQQARLRARCVELGLDDSVRIDGAVPQELIRSCLDAADLLVSPRAGGSNTPLKIFSYMHAGKPVLATRVPAHTQVLDDDCALLVEPTAAGLAAGFAALLADLPAARRRAQRALDVARERYGLPAYLAAVAHSYVPVGGVLPVAAQLERAVRIVEADLALSGPAFLYRADVGASEVAA